MVPINPAMRASVAMAAMTRLTYYLRGGKLQLVNTDENGGLDGAAAASVYHDQITANGEHMDPNAMRSPIHDDP
jgi:rare lipoprotein A (peptidoglycan hydrolase)